MMNLAPNLAALVACAVILARAEPALNCLGCRARLVTRVALYLLLCSASALVLHIVQGGTVGVATAAMAAGVAALIACKRRLRVLVPHGNSLHHPRHR